ncbi:hypothetical protein Pint_30612 [Pistacia integerrima]|uniref:Uncharacterized protein n=1 Tax=Pistacia integerrima TaxID=434235 RepID=A0ACC0WXS4_9ROSI|nr:hypothetical protein Pint_30612 [Pistacia integerrima]
MNSDGADVLFAHCPKLLHLSLEALMKTLLTILARKGFFVNAYANDIYSMSLDEEDNSMEITEDGEGALGKQIQVLVEENIADYVFEILRLSECKDPTVNSCLQVLNLLLTTEQAFKQRLVVGFTALIPVLHHVAEFPFHPFQNQTLKLIWNCIFDCPGILSTSKVEDPLLCLTMMLRRNTDGEMSMLTETFIMAFSVFVATLKSPSSHGI